MIKRTFTAALVAVAMSACQSDKAKEGETSEKQKSSGTKYYDVRDVEFLTPEERTERYGEDWKNNPTITRHLKPDVAVKMDMSESRSIKLDYEKQFALNVKAKSPKGYGSVSIKNQWVKVGDKITIQAHKDKHANFMEWSGDIDGAEINSDEITVTMDKPRNIYAMYLSKEVDLKIESEFGQPKGAGTYDRGSTIAWSVNSPIAITETERAVAREKTGSTTLNDDHDILLIWDHEFLIQTSVNEKGSVDAPAGWVKQGEEITLLAKADDDAYEFVEWEGLGEELAKANPITLSVDKSLAAKAIFKKKEFELTINSEHGQVAGAGLHARGAEVEWTVTSPTQETGITGVRYVTATPSGTITISKDENIDIVWSEQVLVQVIKKHNQGKEIISSQWVDKGTEIKDISVPVQKEETFFWAGDIQEAQIEASEIDIIADKPMTIIADFDPKPNTLTISSNEGEVVAESSNEYYAHQKANNTIPGAIYNSKAERNVLNAEDLKGQMKEHDAVSESHIANPDAIEDNKVTIDFVDYKGWEKCVRLVNDKVLLIVAPQINRVVYLGAPEGDSNLLFINEELEGETVDKASADKQWHDFGGSVTVVAPTQLNFVLLKREFPPAYDFDGAPAAEVITSKSKVSIKTQANAEFDCAIEKTYTIKGNQVSVGTKLIPTGTDKHNFSVGPQTLTEFVMPKKVSFGSSEFKEMHKDGYVNFYGKAPQTTVASDMINLNIAGPSDEGWKVGTHSAKLSLEFEEYTLIADAVLTPGAEVCEKNTNFQVISPEGGLEYLEVSHIGNMNQLEDNKESKVTWTLEKK